MELSGSRLRVPDRDTYSRACYAPRRRRRRRRRRRWSNDIVVRGVSTYSASTTRSVI